VFALLMLLRTPMVSVYVKITGQDLTVQSAQNMPHVQKFALAAEVLWLLTVPAVSHMPH
jgi:hypothetical protein